MKKILIFITVIITLSMAACSPILEKETEVTPDTQDTQSQTASDETKEEAIPVVTKSPEEIETDYKVDTFRIFCDNMDNSMELSDSSKEYIESNPNLFPANSYEDVSSLINHEIAYKHIMKSPGKYDSTFLQISGVVVDIEEITNGDRYVNIIHTMDDRFDSYYTCYIGELPDIFEEDYITIVGIPLGVSSFSNVSGGTTNVIMIAASRIGKN